MSIESTIKYEHYKQGWDPTFHQLIYKLVNNLTNQVHFQQVADTIYNKILIQASESMKEGTLSD